MILLKTYFDCQLTTGGRIIGWIGLVYSLLTILLFIFENLFYHNIDEPIKDINETTTDSNELNEDEDEEASFKQAGFIIALIGEIITALSSLALIIGIKKRKSILLLPWLIIFALSVICTPIAIPVFFTDMPYTASIIPLIILIYAITLVVFIYTWLAVYTLYKQFKSNTPPNRELPEK